MIESVRCGDFGSHLVQDTPSERFLRINTRSPYNQEFQLTVWQKETIAFLTGMGASAVNVMQ